MVFFVHGCLFLLFFPLVKSLEFPHTNCVLFLLGMHVNKSDPTHLDFKKTWGKQPKPCPFRGFLKWWYPTTIVFPTKNDHFGVFWGYHHLRKHPFGKSQFILPLGKKHDHIMIMSNYSSHIFHQPGWKNRLVRSQLCQINPDVNHLKKKQLN